MCSTIPIQSLILQRGQTLVWNRPKRINDSYTLEQANSSLTSLAKLFHFTCQIGSARVCAAVFWPCAPVCHCVASPSPPTNPRLSPGLPRGTWGNSSPSCVCGWACARTRLEFFAWLSGLCIFISHMACVCPWGLRWRSITCGTRAKEERRDGSVRGA